MRRSHDTSPFDHEHETRSDLTQEFWGAESRHGRWAHDDRTTRRVRRVDDTSSMRALRDGVAAFRPRRVELRDATGEVRRTRSHGTVTAPATMPAPRTMSDRRAAATIGDLAAGHFDDDPLDREYDLPLTPTSPAPRRSVLGAVDPLLARLGALVVVGVLLVPVALALRPSSAEQPDTFRIDMPADEVDIAAGAATAVDLSDVVADDTASATSTSGEPASSVVPAPESTTRSESTTDGTGVATSDTSSTGVASTGASVTESTSSTTSSTEAVVGDVGESVGAGITGAATADASAERIVPECPQTYTAAPGDSWYGIADAAGVSPTALMSENRATVETVILAGDDICLPRGATVPTAPSTTSPTNTTAPDTTTAPTTSPETTEAPTTTVASTTPSGSPGRNASVAEVQDVIRSIFPESEWDTAFTIADRESRFVPTAYNGWCCYGVFQIYWNVHRNWLDDLGITSATDLYDPLLNVRAAHAIWQRSGNSWSAWSTYDG